MNLSEAEKKRIRRFRKMRQWSGSGQSDYDFLNRAEVGAISLLVYFVIKLPETIITGIECCEQAEYLGAASAWSWPVFCIFLVCHIYNLRKIKGILAQRGPQNFIELENADDQAAAERASLS
ncbi:hypothetical protein [Persicirhabdus sediminis]|uniref:Uncharacterized protein n=1 Tax=Persicirhabdus sediminis TaxID=454144 RepID=A0A8J7MCT9_9BACT|nr:hypothetical protein [Persicirhabdus sediminis]MBK1790827.1 hypothetical protein [Persicirhabdus sediminis]